MSAKSVVNLLRGSVALEVTGDFPERFLNLCAQRGTAFWGVEQPDGHTLYLTVAWGDRQGLEELAGRTGCVIRERRKRGAPPFFLGFKRRYALLAGLALALGAVLFLSQFIMVVDVEGNETVPSRVILAELGRLGVRPGVYGPGLETRDICNEALIRLEDLSWMTINLHGIRAQVVVRERVKEPELVDDSQLGDIVARAPGIVEHIENWAGDRAVEEGDTVLPGDVLIRGSVKMDPPQWSENPPEWMAVRAKGLVEGRTWRTLSASIPLQAQVKEWTGEKKNGYSVSIFGRRVNFYGNSGIPYDRYDKISRTWNVALPGGETLPFALRQETWREYTTSAADVDRDAAQALLEAQLLERLKALLGETGEEVSHTFAAQVENGTLTVTLQAECREELGRFVPAGETGSEKATKEKGEIGLDGTDH